MPEIHNNFYSTETEEVPAIQYNFDDYEAFVPLNDRVMIRQIHEDNSRVKGSDLIVAADKYKEKSNKAEVVAVGPKVSDVKPGDIVLFSEYNVDEFHKDGETLLLTRFDDLKGVARRKVS
jgi:chaperonin GroES